MQQHNNPDTHILRTDIEQMKLDGALSTLGNYSTDLSMVSQNLDEIWSLLNKLQENVRIVNAELINTTNRLIQNVQEIEDIL
tara:strand:+ start:191 stop:436 length:246 start_codon:yes stop_codon:yes gene_type:complete